MVRRSYWTVKVLPSQVEYGRKLVMLSLVWMPMIDSVAQSLSRTMARGLLLRISTMDLGDIFACSISQVAGSSMDLDIDGENSATGLETEFSVLP
jgi:hypothetical protein